MSELITIAEASRKCGVSRTLVYRWLKQGKVDAIKLEPKNVYRQAGAPAKFLIDVDELRKKGLIDG